MKRKRRSGKSYSSKQAVFTGIVLLFSLSSSDAALVPSPGSVIPDIPVVCTRSHHIVNLGTIALSRASVLLFSGSYAAGGPGKLSFREVAPLVLKYGDVIPWYRVIVRPQQDERLPEKGSSCPVLFHRSFHDMNGRLAAALGITKFPALVVLRRGGEIEVLVDGLGPDDFRGTERILSSIHRSSELRGTKARDFRLPEAGTGWPLSLLDASLKKYTMILLLERDSRESAQEFRLLEGVRNRHRGEAGLVAVFEGGGDAEVMDYLRKYDLTPDFALEDRGARMLETYRLGRLPAFLLVGPDGKILFTKIGFTREDAARMAVRLEQYLSRKGKVTTPFAEARRIHAEGLAWLREGKDSMALIYLERVLEILPEMESVNHRMAEIHGRLGNRREAARCYSRALSSGMCDVGEAMAGLSEVLGAGP